METDNPILYHPAAALVLFKPEGNEQGLYIEHYDMDDNGCPVNPRPLTLREARGLAKALDVRKEAEKAFLRPQGILPPCVLHLNPCEKGSVVWYTKPQAKTLHFADSLGLPSRQLQLPALVWAADRSRLFLYALKGKGKPNLKTPLCFAPFMNLYENGNVCMGSVSVAIPKTASLEEFIAAWQGYFFDSYFSHFIGGNSPIQGNLVSLYKDLMETGSPFPFDVLLTNGKTLKDLLR